MVKANTRRHLFIYPYKPRLPLFLPVFFLFCPHQWFVTTVWFPRNVRTGMIIVYICT